MRELTAVILVADGGNARFFFRERPFGKLEEAEDLKLFATPAAREDEPPTRVHDRFGGHRHAVEKRENAHAAAERAFLQSVAATLVEVTVERKMSELILCAPPKALGILRSALPANMLHLVRASVDKDLVKETIESLQDRIDNL